MKISGGIIGSIKKFEESMKAENTGPIHTLREDETLRVRFLTEPPEWLAYDEHYTDEMKFFPCTEDGCPGCDEGERKSKKYIAPVVVIDPKTERAQKVVTVLKMTKSLAEQLLNRYKKDRSLLIRDFELERTGSRLETTYQVLPAPTAKRSLSGFDIPDLEELLIEATTDEFKDYMGLDTTPKKSAKSKSRRGASTSASARRRPVEDDDDDDDDYDEDDEEDYDEEDEEEDDYDEAPPKRTSAQKRRPVNRAVKPVARRSASTRRRNQDDEPPF